jgi:arginine repressor
MQTSNTQKIESLILSEKIVTFNEIKECLNVSRMTIIRRLRELSYLSSYSHKGKYYTLPSVAKFSEEGLWRYNSVHFSKFDTLINTCYYLVNSSESGYSVKELNDKLHVNVKLSLIELCKRNDLYREKCKSEYVYFNKHFPRRKQQLLIRNSQNDTVVFNLDKLTGHVITDELKAAIILFYSILNEKQRRLYAGLESLKIGHGGDTLISKLLNIDPETVSKGRKELISGGFEKDRVRKQGAGRPEIKKNS